MREKLSREISVTSTSCDIIPDEVSKTEKYRWFMEFLTFRIQNLIDLITTINVFEGKFCKSACAGPTKIRPSFRN